MLNFRVTGTAYGKKLCNQIDGTSVNVQLFRKQGDMIFPTRFTTIVLLAVASITTSGQQPAVRLELIPPSPVTDKIALDMRGAVRNDDRRPRNFDVFLYLDQETSSSRVYAQKLRIPAHASAGIYYRRSTVNWAGKHRVILVAASHGTSTRMEREVEVLSSTIRSPRSIDGAWVGIVHWSEAEGRYWNADIRKLTEDDWREQIRGMHGLGMDTIVVQEVFRNESYYGKNTIASSGYRGQAYYPSALFPERVSMTSHDPLEVILSEADRLDMHVFLGVGLYAWFDFSPDSLAWHKKVAEELWHRYGHHPSFYGWYVSEETYGSLIPDQGEPVAERYRKEIISFFAEFQAFCRQLAPEKPLLFAPNAHGLLKSKDVWPSVLKHIDIICPFAFHRMPSNDLTGEQAANLWQEMADKTGTHLWMDMEAFVFDKQALIPRPIDGLLLDMQRFPNFEKILCYQYSGIFNSPKSRIKPGGAATVKLYDDYLQYLSRTGRVTSKND